MKNSTNNEIEFKENIYNTFKTNYNNDFIEGNNDVIKEVKRIAFCFRLFRSFKARIMICKDLIKLKRKKAYAYASALFTVSNYFFFNDVTIKWFFYHIYHTIIKCSFNTFLACISTNYDYWNIYVLILKIF